MRQKKARFTIMELMIVVAILMILASLLLPALKKARSKAAEVGCRNQLKQIGLLWIQYTDTFDGHLPLSYSSNSNWSSNLYSAGLLKPWKENTGTGLAGREADKRNCKLLQCPGNPSVQTYAGMGCLKWSLGAWESSEEWRIRAVKNSRITFPSERGMVVDHPGQGIEEVTGADGLKKYYPHGPTPFPCPDWTYDPDAGSYNFPETEQEPPPNAMVNAAFCDGHVGGISYFQSEKNSNTNIQRNRFWSTLTSWQP